MKVSAGTLHQFIALKLTEHIRLTAMNQPYICSCEPDVSESRESYSDHIADVIYDLIRDPDFVGASIDQLGRDAFDRGDHHNYYHALAALKAGDTTDCREDACSVDLG